MRIAQRMRRRARIEIIPLIDIVFFLLATFVMVSLSMIKNQGIAVNLPKAATAASQDRKEMMSVTITVTENGMVYLEKEKKSLKDLSARLKALKTSNPDLKIFVNGDEKASFGSAVEVLDEVRKLGISKIAVQTAPEVREKK
jgi:biopolymer transport protein ExbD